MLAIQCGATCFKYDLHHMHACTHFLTLWYIVVVAFPVACIFMAIPDLAMPSVKTEPAAPLHVSGVPAAKAATGRRKITDFRLAQKLEDCRFVRDLLRHTGRLIQWANEDVVNVITLEALGLNYRLMVMVADFHCSQTNVVKPPGINFLKAQA